MKVAFFTESLPPLTDGVSRTLLYLKQTLDSEGIDHRFYSPFYPNDSGWNNHVFRLISIPFPLYTRYKMSLPVFHDLENDLVDFEPDIIHICSPFFSGLAAYNFGEKHGIPVVNSFHTRFVSYMKYYRSGQFEGLAWKYLRWFYNRGIACFAPSHSTMHELNGFGFKNLSLWSRGVDTAKFSPSFADRGLKSKWAPDGRPVALFVGRLVAEKDINILLKAHDILKARKIEYRLVIAGGGKMRSEIEHLAPDAILLGHIEGEELSKAYASADFFVFPSTTETLGNVILEAAASGLPPIAAAEGGIIDLIRDREDGLLARPRDPSDFADKMEELITNDSLRNSLGGIAYDTAIKRDWNSINKGLIEKYEEIIKSYKAKPSMIKHGTISTTADH